MVSESKEIGINQAKPKSTGGIAEYLHTKVGELLANTPQLPKPLKREIVTQAFCRYVNQFTDRTQHLLENVLQANEQPLPMTAVAKSLGYPKRVLYRHLPELCRAISAKYVNYMKESRIKRIEHCCEEVKQAVRQVHTEGIYPSEGAIQGYWLNQDVFVT
ncbi:hypothetical protein [Nostoc sp. UHCC 0870]|uniref:hypothetical protein n=1 Tax=Nostoc sp. UHCC 0870 TaxID=2914041 RepID=UPI001EE03AC1|nr:hypothetical protein [Nostoc sp. UHCC 0870]UKO97567.1 hypothetical protein L6494_23815 [Nostoc sp. UHCC 0870]